MKIGSVYRARRIVRDRRTKKRIIPPVSRRVEKSRVVSTEQGPTIKTKPMVIRSATSETPFRGSKKYVLLDKSGKALSAEAVRELKKYKGLHKSESEAREAARKAKKLGVHSDFKKIRGKYVVIVGTGIKYI